MKKFALLLAVAVGLFFATDAVAGGPHHGHGHGHGHWHGHGHVVIYQPYNWGYQPYNWGYQYAPNTVYYSVCPFHTGPYFYSNCYNGPYSYNMWYYGPNRVIVYRWVHVRR